VRKVIAVTPTPSPAGYDELDAADQGKPPTRCTQGPPCKPQPRGVHLDQAQQQAKLRESDKKDEAAN
jgi:hypothetical protein